MGELDYNLGIIYAQGRYWQAAHQALELSRARFENAGQKDNLASVYGYLAQVESELGHTDKALEYAQTRVSLVRSKNQGPTKSLSSALLQLADAHARKVTWKGPKKQSPQHWR
jgi:hypothetical protein